MLSANNQTFLKIKDLQNTLKALYGLNDSELYDHFLDLPNEYSFITDLDPLDYEMWELLEEELKNDLDPVKNELSVQDKIDNIRLESKNKIDKREKNKGEVKIPKNKDYSAICIKTKSRSANKLNKSKTITNTSVTAVKQDNVVLQHNYLHNIDRYHALLFLNQSKQIILIRKKDKTEINLGYFIDLYPSYNYVFTVDTLTPIELVKLNGVILALRDQCLTYGEMGSSGDKKIADLRAWLHLTNHIGNEYNILFKQFEIWLSGKSFKALENWIQRKRKQYKIHIPIQWYNVSPEGIVNVDKMTLYKIWARSEIKKSLSGEMRMRKGKGNTLRRKNYK